uniref:Uncharacterized protein n=1 Tax=Anguilla anguilla TaxID=7936 RepID=A0A0E9S7A7_ANGAN
MASCIQTYSEHCRGKTCLNAQPFFLCSKEGRKCTSASHIALKTRTIRLFPWLVRTCLHAIL